MATPRSWPSRALTIIDIPEVRKFEAKWKYNFFVPDEKVNESGSYVDEISGKTVRLESGNIVGGYGETDELRRTIPRWVEFHFKPVTAQTNIGADNEFIMPLSRPENIKEIIKPSMIQRETDVSTGGYTALVLQDDKIEQKASKLMQSHAQGFKKLWPKLNRQMESQDIAQVRNTLNAVTSNLVTGKMINKCLGSLTTGLTHPFTGRKQIKYTPRWVEQIKDISHYSQFNDKYYSNIIRRAIMNTMGPFSGELSSLQGSAKEIQKEARDMFRAGMMLDSDYEIDLTFISQKATKPGIFRNDVKIIGYIVDKQQHMPNGSIEDKDPIILPSPIISNGIDSEVMYGAVYSYSARAIALVQLQTVDQATGATYVSSALVSSRKSPSSTVECLEYSPPPPPGDIDFMWDYRRKRLTIAWSFPVVRQRDIKRFQVFRRDSIYSSFELLAEYDFDDSYIRDPRKESPREDRVFLTDRPTTTYVDEQFTKESRYIYALCSIDAHDFSSNYSQQFVVTFDEIENRIKKQLISPHGAPKSYPNFYLMASHDQGIDNIELTSDAIKDSGHTKGTIFFDPEYLSIVDRDDRDLGLLSMTKLTQEDEEGRYKLQMINVDRQKSKVFNIDLKDLRTLE